MTRGRGSGLRRGVGRALLAVIILAVAAGVIWYRRVALETRPPETAPEMPGPGNAEMVLRDFRHVETKMDRTIWVLEAKRAEVTGDVARLRTVKITWYGDDERQQPVVVTGRTGKVNLRSQNAALRGRVRVARADGATLATARIFWDNRRRELRAPFPVTIRTDRMVVRARRMEANLATETVNFHGAVRARIAGASEPPKRGG